MREKARNEARPYPAAPVLEPTYTVAEIAAYFKTGREEVHRWIRANQLRAIRHGKLVRVRAVDLTEFTTTHLTVPDDGKRA
jgi:excisionase family DNA binding protein